jgi:hypothetical protein
VLFVSIVHNGIMNIHFCFTYIILPIFKSLFCLSVICLTMPHLKKYKKKINFRKIKIDYINLFDYNRLLKSLFFIWNVEERKLNICLPIFFIDEFFLLMHWKDKVIKGTILSSTRSNELNCVI